MAKAILEFNLDDPDDNRHHLQCVKAKDMAIVLWNLRTDLLSRMKITDRDSQEYINGVEDTVREVYKMLNEWDINVDELN
jgi:hypothetical protein